RQGTAAGQNEIRQREESRGRYMRLAAREPARAPDVGNLPPTRKRGSGMPQPRERGFLVAYVGNGIAWGRLDGAPHRQRFSKRALQASSTEQPAGGVSAARRLPRRHWWAPQAIEPRAQKAVTGLQAVVKKRQRPVGRQRGKPQGQPSELHGHRIEIDA